MKRLSVLALALLPACDPAELADKAVRRTAETVVFPVVNVDMPADPAQAATGCILDAARPDELRLLARDVGGGGWNLDQGHDPDYCPAPRGAGLLCGSGRAAHCRSALMSRLMQPLIFLDRSFPR